MVRILEPTPIGNFLRKAFPNQAENAKQGKCAWCGGPANEFKDEISRKEFTISGFCQSCQDKTFGE